MIEFSTALAKLPEKVPNHANSGGDPAIFATALADYLKAGDPAPPDDPALPAFPAKRQNLAAGGEALPDDADTEIDPTLIWLPVALPQPLPAVQTAPLPGAAPKLAINAALPGLVPTPLLTVDPALTEAASPQTGAHGAGSAATIPGKPVIDVSALIPVEAKPIPTQPVNADDAVTRRDAPVLTAGTPVSPPPVSTAQPAGQAFAAAILAAAGHGQRGATEDDRPMTATALASTLTAIAEAHRPIVQATADAQRAPLDLRQDTGLQAMIDRIEILRDDADSRDTRIRLVPDALGAVDVAVRKHGDTLHVHFAAENAATRTLLNDAQPRLAELAEARGVRIAQSSVDSGGNGTGRQPHQPAPVLAAAPARIRPAVDTETNTDQRIA
ncbi:flagellar hook-length control protein FliK [Sphingomonas sp. ERG5]|uniref:flagellar hook-length control protein FliK n=1 Tax=Sphingomonas sp. ERG5 TaxID=1381597 RepID=UPI00054BC59F|nr:flagellar hook-length control protein FliK [Sphingomonas sp. ERG5]